MDPTHLIEMNQGMLVSGILLALSVIGIFTDVSKLQCLVHW